LVFDVSVLIVSVFFARGFLLRDVINDRSRKKKCKFGENRQNEVFTFFSWKQWLEEIVAKIVVTFGNNCSC
jgi:hypothetical protein